MKPLYHRQTASRGTIRDSRHPHFTCPAGSGWCFTPTLSGYNVKLKSSSNTRHAHAGKRAAQIGVARRNPLPFARDREQIGAEHTVQAIAEAHWVGRRDDMAVFDSKTGVEGHAGDAAIVEVGIISSSGGFEDSTACRQAVESRGNDYFAEQCIAQAWS
ncbi:MAG: hypothetical protein L0Y43_10760 [Methylococcaceae bacterium]|nr:hypothetical protein [Methylococcaceae bacterium]